MLHLGFENGKTLVQTYNKIPKTMYRERRYYGTRGRGRGDHRRNIDREGCDEQKNRHPSGLRGREIGLFYAQRSKQQNEQNYPSLTMNNSLIVKSNKLINDLNRHSSEPKMTFKSPGFGSSDTEDRLDEIVGCRFKELHEKNLMKAKSQMEDDENIATPKLLVKDDKFDNMLTQKLDQQQNDRQLNKMIGDRKKLPSYEMRHEILDAIEKNPAIVLSGQTGCGKTTQVPQFILDNAIEQGRGSLCRVVCTQPRRISAISVAKRVADERAESLGESVGYKIRLEQVDPRRCASITYCTTGIVLKWLQSDPLLLGISHLVLDEVHERDTLSDFLLCIARDLLPKRPDLRVIMMSATLNAEQFSQYYGQCPMLHIPGFTFPIQEFFLEDIVEKLRYSFPVSEKAPKYNKRSKSDGDFEEKVVPAIRNLGRSPNYSMATISELCRPESEEIDFELILKLILDINSQPPGGILVFFPGLSEIKTMNTMLSETREAKSMAVYPLHSKMPTINQREVFDPPKPGIRKVILSTNIAETSITINDIVYVIDSGKIKLTSYDKKANVSTLSPEWVSLANANQRRGRSGRVKAGICYHLFTRARRDILDEFAVPEIKRTRLEEVVLMVKILRLGLSKPFLSRVLEPPHEEVLTESLKLLRLISALDDDEDLTPLGYHLARLPMDPLIGKMLIMGAIFSCLDPILTITASLSFKSPFMFVLGKEEIVDQRKFDIDEGDQSDHLVLTKVFSDWERNIQRGTGAEYAWKNFLSTRVLHEIKNLRGQFMETLYDHKFVKSTNPNAQDVNRNSNDICVLRAVIAAGLYPNVSRILVNHRDKVKGFQVDGKRVEVHLSSVNSKHKHFDGKWLMYLLRLKTSKVFLFDTTMVSNYPLVFFGAHLDYDNEKKMLLVDKMVKFKCDRRIYEVVKGLREELNHLLAYKISNPNTNVWEIRSLKYDILHLIIDILHHEAEEIN